MVNVFTLLLIAFSAVFSIVWIIHYIPLHSTVFGLNFSPRLIFCKFLAPMDATLTIILIAGAWIGLSTSVLGISTIIYNVLTGLGLSGGVVFIKRVMLPRWTEEYTQKLEDNQRVKI
jgi:hypothetical protein